VALADRTFYTIYAHSSLITQRQRIGLGRVCALSVYIVTVIIIIIEEILLLLHKNLTGHFTTLLVTKVYADMLARVQKRH